MEENVICSMVGCTENRNAGSVCYFHPFPTDFNMCMLWVQNSGKAEYFEEFAFRGAQPFIKKLICSNHFTQEDYNNDNFEDGLKENAIPILNTNAIPPPVESVEIKQEPIDLCEPNIEDEENFEENFEENSNSNSTFNFENNPSENATSTLNTEMEIKPEPIDIYDEQENLNYYETIGINGPELADNLSNEFYSMYRTQLEKDVKTNTKLRKRKDALRAQRRRQNETPEQTKERLMKDALRASYRRRNETPEQRTIRRQKEAERSRLRRQMETEEQTRLRRLTNAAQASLRRQNEPEEKKQARRAKDKERASKRRILESPEQREIRLLKDRERATKTRLIKKIALQLTQLHHYGQEIKKEDEDSQPPLPSDIKNEAIAQFHNYGQMVLPGFFENMPQTHLKPKIDNEMSALEPQIDVRIMQNFKPEPEKNITNEMSILEPQIDVKIMPNFIPEPEKNITNEMSILEPQIDVKVMPNFIIEPEKNITNEMSILEPQIDVQIMPNFITEPEKNIINEMSILEPQIDVQIMPNFITEPHVNIMSKKHKKSIRNAEKCIPRISSESHSEINIIPFLKPQEKNYFINTDRLEPQPFIDVMSYLKVQENIPDVDIKPVLTNYQVRQASFGTTPSISLQNSEKGSIEVAKIFHSQPIEQVQVKIEPPDPFSELPGPSNQA